MFCTVYNDALEVYWYLVVIVIVWLPLVILVVTVCTYHNFKFYLWNVSDSLGVKMGSCIGR